MGDMIDLNCDMGESLGPWPMGADAAILPFVTSANIACGFHAGDPLGLLRTVALAVRQGVAIGAHPGYPDLVGFGRRVLEMSADELEAAIIYQVGALAGLVAAQRSPPTHLPPPPRRLGPVASLLPGDAWTTLAAAGPRLTHVKPHGALYNRAAADPAVAAPIVRAVARGGSVPPLVFVGLAGSRMLDVARGAGLPVAAEAFADRAYEADGRLRARTQPGALLTDPLAAAAQALRIVQDQQVIAYDGTPVAVQADTLCIHGDTPGAPAIAEAVRTALERAGIAVRPLRPVQPAP